MVQQKDKLDYERANKKPLEFMEKFDERVVVQKKVKQGARTGIYTYSEKTRSRKVNSVVSEKTRAVILKSKQQ